MLDGVIAEYFESLSEIAFFDPFAAILRANGFYDVHRTHGSSEFGRDFIAKRSEEGVIYQYGIQTKVGDLGLSAWREVRNQIEDIRLMTSANPNFDQDLPRKAVLATTGRLVGQAPSSADNYRQQCEGEMDFEVWQIEHLIEMMVDAPESGLAGALEAPLIGAIAAIHLGSFREKELDSLSLGWIETGGGLWRRALAALVIAERLANSDRRDLACLVGIHLVRSTWASVHGIDPAPPEATAVADVGRGIVVQHAHTLMVEYEGLPAGSSEFLRATIDPGAMVTYPVRCMRLLELFGLAGLAVTNPGERAAFTAACKRLIRELPGCTHPMSDNWAVSIVPPAVLLWEVDPLLVASWLRQICVWVADRYERGQVGLARALASPEDEVRQLLGGSLEFMEITRRPESLLASVLLDIAAALELADAYNDIINDVMAVDTYPQVVECDDDMTQYRDQLPGVYVELWMRYDETIETSSGWPCAPHHHRWQPCYLERLGRYWDLLAICSVMRDRCFPGLIREVAGLAMAPS